MRSLCLIVFLVTAATLLLVSEEGYSGNLALAQSPDFSNAAAGLDKQCPSSPDNVPSTFLKKVRDDTFQQDVRLVGDTLIIEGTVNSDHILIKGGGPAGVVRIIFDGKELGSFGPVARIVVRAGDGNDVVIVKPQVTLPARLEGGAGDDCLQGGSGPELLFGEDGDDTLVGTRGRDALHAGQGSNRIVIAQPMGEIRVTPSADGALLQQLATAYTLRGLHPGRDRSARASAAHTTTPSPILLGATDLGDTRIEPLLREAYQAGQAVALTNATDDDAARLRSLLGHPNAADPTTEANPSALIFVRKTPRPGGTFDFSTGAFPDFSLPEPPARAHEASERAIELMSRIFSTMAILPKLPDDSPENDLLKIADSYTTHTTNQDSFGNQVQITNSAWSVRSFTNQNDLYYILQELDFYTSASTPTTTFLKTGVNNNSAYGDSLIQSSPASTQCTTSTTSGVSWNVGGSTGWNQMQGLNAALTGGVSISNSQTITCPSIGILNQSNVTDTSQWEYGWQPVSEAASLQTFYNNWIWVTDWDDYLPTQSVISIFSTAQSQYVTLSGSQIPGVTAYLLSNVPLPFGQTFALQKPVVLSVSPTCVNAGDTFTITGTGMYPSLVTSVLIGGTPLDSSQYTTVNNTSITVIAPEMSGEALSVDVKTTVGESDSNVTIEISVIDACNL
jgi:hypothetical protein